MRPYLTKQTVLPTCLGLHATCDSNSTQCSIGNILRSRASLYVHVQFILFLVLWNHRVKLESIIIVLLI